MLIEPEFTSRLRAVPVRPLADVVAAVLLAPLAAVGLLPEIDEHERVEEAADLNTEIRMLVVGIDTIGDGQETDTEKTELGDQREHEDDVPCKTGQIVDQDDVDQPLTDDVDKIAESGTVIQSAGLRPVREDVTVQDHEASLRRKTAAGRDLIFDALRPLVLRAVSSVDASPRHESSSPDDRPSGA